LESQILIHSKETHIIEISLKAQLRAIQQLDLALMQMQQFKSKEFQDHHLHQKASL